MEALDSRRLLSAAVSGTQLVITGTDARDHVLISVDPTDASMLMVNLNGEAQSFARSAITNVSADLGTGSDFFVVDQTDGDVTVSMDISGGGGADVIVAGGGNDTIMGGGGRDRIDAGSGDDLVRGGAGGDQIAGRDGNDTLVGGTGDDALDGGQGEDNLVGNSGDDHLDGAAGDDVITGGGGFDSLVGGIGDDSLNGGRGDDDLDGGAGTNDLAGGAGSDGFAHNDDATDLLDDDTTGDDHVYTLVTMDSVPEQFQTLFQQNFPQSLPTAVRVNDDHTFDLLYQYNPTGETYAAHFSFASNLPFQNVQEVELVSYEVAPSALPDQTAGAFAAEHPDAAIKQVMAVHKGQTKYAEIRYQEGNHEPQWAEVEWMDGQANN